MPEKPTLDWVMQGPAPEEDFDFLANRLPILQRRHDAALLLHQADADGRTGGRDPSDGSITDEQIRAAAQQWDAERPARAKMPKGARYAAISRVLGWDGRNVDRIRRALSPPKLRRRSWDDLVARWPALEHQKDPRRQDELRTLEAIARAEGIPWPPPSHLLDAPDPVIAAGEILLRRIRNGHPDPGRGLPRVSAPGGPPPPDTQAA